NSDERERITALESALAAARREADDLRAAQQEILARLGGYDELRRRGEVEQLEMIQRLRLREQQTAQLLESERQKTVDLDITLNQLREAQEIIVCSQNEKLAALGQLA